MYKTHDDNGEPTQYKAHIMLKLAHDSIRADAERNS